MTPSLNFMYFEKSNMPTLLNSLPTDKERDTANAHTDNLLVGAWRRMWSDFTHARDTISRAFCINKTEIKVWSHPVQMQQGE